MKAYMIWLKTELKRVAGRLPSLFIGAVVLTLLVGAIAFCALIAVESEGENVQVGAKVALVAPDDALTEMAISFVTEMESVKDWCYFERCSLEEGLVALEQAQVVALIELPDNLIQSILDGSNIPAKLYLPGEVSLGGELLEIIAQAGISLLQVAQGEIYATTDLYADYPMDESLSELYEDINLYNLNLSINRENLFKHSTLSETGGLDVASYYGASAICLVTLLFGLLMTDVLLEHTQRDRMLHLSRVSMGAQIIGRWKVLTGVNFVWSFLLLLFLRMLLRSKESVWENLQVCLGASLQVLLAVGCMTAIYLLVGCLVRDKMSFMFIVGVGVFVLGYVSGYFVPSGLLGQWTKQIAVHLPTTYLHHIYSGILAGAKLPAGYLCLTFWLVVGLGLTVLLRGRRCAE